PVVKVFSGVDQHLMTSFMAYDGSFRGGVNVAAGDLDRDGFAEVIAGAGLGGGPQVAVFRIPAGYHVLPGPGGPAPANTFPMELTRSFFVADPNTRGGVRVAAGDVNGDGFADIITTSGPGGAPNIMVIDGNGPRTIWNIQAFDPSFTGGVYVAAGD